MAEVTGSGNVGNDKYWRHVWTGLGNGDTGKPVSMSGLADKTVSVDGTFSTGGELTVQGSMDGSTWFTMSDTTGTTVVLSSASAVVLAENPKFIRPNITGGDGSTVLNVRIGASAVA